MELTTRCPECETIFTVSLEQLQLRKGYIRCIQCAHIFDGFEAVLPVGAPASPPSAKPAARVEPSPPRPQVRHTPDTPPSPVRPIGGASPGRPAGPPPRHVGPTLPPPEPLDVSIHDTTGPAPFIIPPADRPASAPSGKLREFTIGSERNPTVASTAKEPVVGPSRISAGSSTPYIGNSADLPVTPGAREPSLPSVVRERPGKSVPLREPVISTEASAPVGPRVTVDRDAEETDAFFYVEPRPPHQSGRARPTSFEERPSISRWMAPVWGVLALCGMALLVAQGLYIYRAQLANNFPSLRPMLEEACAELSCSIPYERRLDAIAITGSALRANAAPQDGVSSLTLEVTLRNTYDRPQEWPTLVLDLKDASGTIVVRRNLPPDTWVPVELRTGPFAPGADLTVQVPLTVQDVQANGYQLDKFFP